MGLIGCAGHVQASLRVLPNIFFFPPLNALREHISPTCCELTRPRKAACAVFGLLFRHFVCSVRRLAITVNYKEENLTGYMCKHTGFSHAYASGTVNSVWDRKNLHCRQGT